MGILGNNYDSGNGQAEDTNKILDDMKSSRRTSIFFFLAIIVGVFIYSMFGQQMCGGETTTGKTPLSQEKCPFITEFFHGISDYTRDKKEPDIVSTNLQEESINFYTATGVQPVLYDLSDDTKTYTEKELQDLADGYYTDGIFNTVYKTGGSGELVEGAYDEGHFIIVFQGKGDSYQVAYHVGEDAKAVMDDAALGIFGSILANNFTKKQGAEIFVSTYKDAQNEIMGKSKGTVTLIIVVVAILVIYAGFTAWKNTKKYRNERGGK